MSIFSKIKRFYQVSPIVPPLKVDDEKMQQYYKKLRLSTFFASTIGYALYHICRTSLNVMKGPIMESGILNATQLGVIGSIMLFTYAIGRFVNGLLADHSNIKRFMVTGMIGVSAANFLVGIFGLVTVETALISNTAFFILFAFLWGINGWSQSMGASPATVGLSRWFPLKSRGTFYGLFSGSRNLGEFMAFIIIGIVISIYSWEWGFIIGALISSVGIFIILKYMHDSPESMGLPNVKILSGEIDKNTKEQIKVGEAARIRQRYALHNKNVWLIAITSSFMHVARYAITGWGVLFLQEHKGFSLSTATKIISVNALMGVLGTMFSGWLSDKYFKGDRKILVLLFSTLNLFAICLFIYSGDSLWINTLSMFLFGCSVGVLVSFLGGLMAVEAVPRSASGVALGIVGIVSYLGAGLQDLISGLLIEQNKVLTSNDIYYDFSYVSYFWIGASALTLLLSFFIKGTRFKKGDIEKLLEISPD